ncbi:MAG TPA: class F sortase [Dehalococcoidia bacterium]|nr:class F sortase [Dehalococcoidia bacterium]
MAPRIALRPLASLLLAGLAVALLLQLGVSTRPAVAAAAANLDFPIASCATPGSATVSFSWQSADAAIEVWLDTSSDGSFSPGAFQAAGPFGGSTSAYSWHGLKTDTPYFARVNSRTAAGWVSSEPVAFVPCGAPALLSYTPSCAGEAVAASFHWAPASPPVVQQIVDAGSDQGFGPAQTRSSGPLLPLLNHFDVSGLRANVTNYFRISAVMPDGSLRRSQVRSFSPSCGVAGADQLLPTGDSLVYSRLNINAPVNVRKVGADGSMGLPEGKDDVILYDFTPYDGLGGAPGKGGVSVFAGHLDFRPNFQAVFWDLAKARVGDRIDYYRADGSRFTYEVTWASLISSNEFLNQYFVSTNPETILLITCEGNFDTAQRNYDKRALVYAVAVN